MTDWQNTLEWQNFVAWQESLEWQTDKQRMEWLNKEISDKTQELEALNIDTISSAEFRVIEETISSYSEEWKRLYNENNPENREQLNQIRDNLNRLEKIKNEINQKILNQTNADLNQLSGETVANQNQVVQNQDTPEQSEPEKKWISGWWKWLTDWQKKWIRIVWWVWAVWWLVALFRRRKKKKKGSSSESAWNKESFWDRPIWKVVKWTWIWTWVYYVVHWLSTGRRNLKDLFEWWKDKVDDSVSQATAYEKLTPEQREQYEKIWNGVNDMYWKIWEREISMWFEDENVLWSISNKIKFKDWWSEANYAWLVPFCIDKDSKNVREILSERNVNEYLFNKNKSELINKLKWWSADRLENFLWPFVDKLQSFQVLGFQPGASLWERIKQWLDYNPDERKEELDFFFRQYLKVLVFLKDRETLLKYKVAESVLENTGYNWKKLPEDEDDKREFIQEVLDDEDWVKANIEKNNIYKDFMNSKLVSVNKILESQNISNWEISAEMQIRLEALDDNADDILQIGENNNTILDKWLNEIWWGLSDKTSKNLMKMCDDVQEDMVDGLWTWFFEEYCEWLTHLCNTEENNRQVFLQESGLLDIVEWMSSIMDEYKEKIQNKTITADDLQKLKKISLEYFAMKKEIEVAMYTMKNIKDDNPANAWFRILWSFCSSVQNIVWWEWKFGDWLTVWISISVVWGIIYVVKHPLKSGQAVLKAVGRVWAGGLHAAGRAWWRTLLTSRWLGWSIDRLASKGVPLIEQKKYLLYYVLNGKAHEESKIIRLASTKFSIEAKSGPDLIRQMCNLEMDQAEMAWKYSWDKNIRKLYLDSWTDWVHSRKRDVFLHHKATKSFEFDKNVLNSLKEIDSTIEGMDKAAGKWMKKLLKWVKEVEDLSTLKVLAKNENFVNQLKTLNRAELRQFRKHLKEFRGEKLNKILTWELKIKDAVAPFMRNGWRQSVEVISDARAAFNARINTEIIKISSEGGDYSKVIVSRLEDLKDVNKVPLTESEIKWFTNFLNEWFDVRYLHELQSLCDMQTPVTKKWSQAFWTELKRLLAEWDYDWFKTLITRSKLNGHKELKQALRQINCDALIRHIDDIAKFNKLRKLWTNVWDDAVKFFVKVLSKIL